MLGLVCIPCEEASKKGKKSFRFSLVFIVFFCFRFFFVLFCLNSHSYMYIYYYLVLNSYLCLFLCYYFFCVWNFKYFCFSAFGYSICIMSEIKSYIINWLIGCHFIVVVNIWCSEKFVALFTLITILFDSILRFITSMVHFHQCLISIWVYNTFFMFSTVRVNLQANILVKFWNTAKRNEKILWLYTTRC